MKTENTDALAVVAAWCVRLLVADHTDDTLVGQRKLLITDWLAAFVALEAFLVPLTAFVLELLHSCKQ